jgi:hypothetical protein
MSESCAPSSNAALAEPSWMRVPLDESMATQFRRGPTETDEPRESTTLRSNERRTSRASGGVVFAAGGGADVGVGVGGEDASCDGLPAVGVGEVPPLSPLGSSGPLEQPASARETTRRKRGRALMGFTLPRS